MRKSEFARPTDIAPIEILDPIGWQDKPVPERRWLVDDLIPLHNVTLVSGDGGIGKSLLTLQLMVACVLGKRWLGRSTMDCRAFGLFCEDDPGELHRRLLDVARRYDADLGDLENLQLCSRVGLENSLMDWQSAWEAGETTWLHAQIMNHALEFGAQVVVLDSLHDVFSGDEIRRAQARQFIQGLREIAREIDGAVILTAHPSLSGRNSGTGESGSTAWNNSVRSRLYLTKADETAPDGDRLLKTMKANYARGGGEIRLQWREGVFRAIDEDQSVIGSIERRRVETVFLELLDALHDEGREVTDKSRAGNFAPRIFAQRPEASGYDKRAFERAMEMLFSQKAIEVETYGRPSRQFTRIIRSTKTHAE